MPSAIANDDRPASPQPAIASPVAAPLTIKSLAGRYKAIIDEQELKKFSRSIVQKLSNRNMRLETIESELRKASDQLTITINASGTFETRNYENQRGRIRAGGTFETCRDGNQRGKARLDGNKLILTADSAKLVDGTNGSTNISRCSKCCTFILNVSADRKMLLVDATQNSCKILRGYVKQ